MADSLLGRRFERNQDAAERTATSRRVAPALGVLALGLVLGGCGGGGGAAVGEFNPVVHPQLTRVDYGRIVDVFGLRNTGSGLVRDLYATDVMIGPNIQDERGPGDLRPDPEVLYDFVGSNPDTLQPRLFITREIGSDEFNAAFDALDDRVSQVAPQAAGQLAAGQSYSVVPRNAAIRLVFSGDLGIDDSFFVERDAQGQVTGIRNGQAVQLLQISGAPNDPASFLPLPARIVVDRNRLILDPVLLGTEGLQYQTRNNAAGLPASPDSTGANIRIAIALEGPLAIPSLRGDPSGGLVGINNVGRLSIIRDFRSGNNADSTPEIARGFVRDPEPPRLVGEIVMFLERVDPVDQFSSLVTLYKNGVRHELDRGDVIRFVADSSGVPFASAEIVADPEDDRGRPGVQHVRARVRFVPNLESIDPSNRPGYPTTPSELEEWLVLNAPRAVAVCEYQGGQFDDTVTPPVVIIEPDDPRYFITFSPTPLPYGDGTPSEPNENVSPFAGAVLRFTKPVDLDSAKWADTIFFATRNVLDQEAIDEFIATRPWRRLNETGGVAAQGVGMDRGSFDADKFRTPHLIASRVIDEDGSQTALRLEPLLGFYLDDAMRNDGNRPYFMHVVAGAAGIVDLAGNALDLQSNDVDRSSGMVIPFTLDVRRNANRPQFENNLAVSVVRRLASNDEDENPSYYLPTEVQGQTDAGSNARAFALSDLFGAYVTLEGAIQGRPTSRLRKVADNLNQAPVAAQGSVLRWCPESVFNEEQTAANTSTTPFGQGIQNPLNPFGARLQTVWREIDLSLSRVDPFDFNLDIEQMYWAPFASGAITFDEFDSLTLFLGHSERRPEPCVGNFSALASLPNSGLQQRFDDNWVRNLVANGNSEVESRPQPYSAYKDSPAPMRIDSSLAVREVNGVNRFLPLPEFRRPYFVYRDETVIEQGCASGVGSDNVNSNTAFNPYIISPWNHGLGRRAVQEGNEITFVNGFWNNGLNHHLRTSGQADPYTDGLVGNVALPLLADFWTGCDSPDLPEGNGYVAFGTNGWQISLTVQSGPQPNFRVYSAGRPQLSTGPAICVSPGSTAWDRAAGGYTPTGAPTSFGDNSFYWIMIDFLKRASVVTNGFVDLFNPHRVPVGHPDSRLGPYFQDPVTGLSALPTGIKPVFSTEIDPPLSQLPGGTSILPQFRAASTIGSTPWYWDEWVVQRGGSFYPTLFQDQLRPDDSNFALDPYKAGDAHIRKFDDRPSGTAASRNYWSYLYNQTVTTYVEDPNQLMDVPFLNQFAGPNNGFTPSDVRYINWRFLMSNNIDANPPVAPTLETFALSYRFERVR